MGSASANEAHLEIERRFLPVRLPSDLESFPATTIRQGYLSEHGSTVTTRVRRRGDQTVLTIKTGQQGLAQTEVEVPISAAQFEALWPFTKQQRVHKTRYQIPLDGGITADLDVYHDALDGRLVAEVEFDSEAAAKAFKPPAWLGDEVSTDPQYRAHALAVNGWPTG